MTLARMLSLALVMAGVSFQAEARTRHVDPSAPVFDRAGGSSEIGSRMFIRETSGKRVRHSKRATRGKVSSGKYNSRASSSTAAQLLPHPVGCPSRAFCGCGASIEVFGRSIRELWLASAWFKFPRAEPAPGMVAVRRHHVFVIREVRAPGLVLAYDANSGGRRTRLHLRSLAGFTVVNPRGGSRYATAD